ncbi:hypothetical protein AAY473_007790 [Plecturocebus cupreus]
MATPILLAGSLRQEGLEKAEHSGAGMFHNMSITDQVCWFMPVIQHFGKPRQADHLRSQEFETSLANMVKPHLYQKYKKSAGHSGTRLRSGSYLEIQHYGRPRWVNHLRSGVRDQPGQHGKTTSTKNTKISQAWWLAPVIPATREAKAGESLEPRRLIYGDEHDNKSVIGETVFHDRFETELSPEVSDVGHGTHTLWLSFPGCKMGMMPLNNSASELLAQNVESVTTPGAI